MTTTPPPSYPSTLSTSDLKAALPTVQLAVPAIKTLDIESPHLVNVFNYTGVSFSENEDYEHANLLPSFPELSYPAIEEFEHDDRGFYASEGLEVFYREVKEQGGRVKILTPAIGAVVIGASLKSLSPAARDDLALFIAQRGVVFFRDQHDLDIHSQLDLGRHWGKLHVHATTGVPREAGLQEVHVVYADKGARPDPTAFSKPELYHSDVTYEIQPPGPTILKLITAPECGGDTLFSSGAALYSSLSEGYQKYLEGLYAVHSAKEQTAGAKGAGQWVRRESVDNLHPVVRVHPVTGVKSVFINAGFTRRIVGLPKSESDNTLAYLNREFALNPDFSCRFQWEKDDVAIWDNRVLNHSALFDFWPERRHGVRVTPHGERPLSVAEYEAKYQKPAKDWAVERYRAMGAEPVKLDAGGGLGKGERGFKD